MSTPSDPTPKPPDRPRNPAPARHQVNPPPLAAWLQHRCEVYSRSPAAKAGLTTGDTITAVNGTAATSATALHDAIAAHDPGDSIRLTWTDRSSTSRTVTVTLVAGPAD